MITPGCRAFLASAFPVRRLGKPRLGDRLSKRHHRGGARGAHRYDHRHFPSTAMPQ
jgi:hypothetical protein